MGLGDTFDTIHNLVKNNAKYISYYIFYWFRPGNINSFFALFDSTLQAGGNIMHTAGHKVLAVASRGGHWVQLMRLVPAFEGCNVIYITTDAGIQLPGQKNNPLILRTRNPAVRNLHSCLLGAQNALSGLMPMAKTKTAASHPGMPEQPLQYIVPDANRSTKGKMLLLLIHILTILYREKPSIVLSTGAASWLCAVVCGKLFGAKTVWVDSIANVDKISMSGRLARPFADLFLTQWEHLARDGKIAFKGNVLTWFF